MLRVLSILLSGTESRYHQLGRKLPFQNLCIRSFFFRISSIFILKFDTGRSGETSITETRIGSVVHSAKLTTIIRRRTKRQIKIYYQKDYKYNNEYSNNEPEVRVSIPIIG